MLHAAKFSVWIQVSQVEVKPHCAAPLVLIFLAASKTSGLIYLEAGKTYSFSGVADDSLLVTIGAVACRRAPLFGPIVLMHVVVTVVLLTLAGMRIWPRFFFADVGFVLLLIVLGVQAVCGWMAGWALLAPIGRWLFPLAAAAMLVISAGLAARNYQAPKQDLIGAVTLVGAERQAGERVYAAGPAWDLFHGYFGMDWAPLESEAEWQAALAEPGPFLLVVAFPGRMLRTIPGIEAAETAGTLALVKAFPGTLGDGYVLVYRRGNDG